jgi:putative peptidoglycan lipid II flippase
MLLPYSIVTISIVTALLPHLSKLAIAKNVEEVRKQLIRAIRMVGVVTVPSAVALLLFGPLMTEVLYMGISLEDSRYIGFVLSALSLGLVAFSINLILIRGFNAFEDTKTQVTSIVIINVISVGLSYVFLATLDSDWVTVGLGIAFSASYIVGLFITISLLKKHVGKLQISEFASQHGRLLVAALIGMLPFFALTQYFGWAYEETALSIRGLRLVFVLIGSGVAYLLCAKLFKVSEIAGLRGFATSVLQRRRKK